MNNPLNVQSLIESGPSKKVFYLRLSDFHKMTVTVKKVIFQKLDTKIIHYRDYQKYCNYSFRQDVLSTLVNENMNLGNGACMLLSCLVRVSE